MLKMTRTLLRTLYVLNLVAGAAFIVLLARSFPIEAVALRKIVEVTHATRPDAVLAALRGVLGIGIAAAALAHILFNRLLAIVGTVAAGDPFVDANARRLHAIAWALLALQLLDLGFGLIDWRVAALTGDRLGWSPSFTGWVAVVMTFVLARVFAAGAAMRDDLAGTV